MTIKDEFQRNYPFLTCVKSSEIEYLGVVINSDHQVISLYDYSDITNENEKLQFLELAEAWWWESNRKIPINIFLKNDMSVFRKYIRTFNVKDIKVVFGPTVSLNEIAEKRVKRKSIQLVRSPRKSKS